MGKHDVVRNDSAKGDSPKTPKSAHVNLAFEGDVFTFQETQTRHIADVKSEQQQQHVIPSMLDDRLREIPLVKTLQRHSADRQTLPGRLQHQPEHLRVGQIHKHYTVEKSDLPKNVSSSPKLSRSQSLRLSNESSSLKEKDRKKHTRLLRDLSFSDSDGKRVHKYGQLTGVVSLPNRPMGSISESGPESASEKADDVFSDVIKTRMTSLMQELIDRGKVQQMAVIDRSGETIVTSLPAWPLSQADVTGIVKAVTSTYQAMLKMTIENQAYSCFKHGQTKMVARAGDSVLVAQASATCVTVARSSGDTPGSSLYELEEFVDALSDRGW